MEIASYRRISDGRLMNEAQLRKFAKPNNSRMQVFLANDPTTWGEEAFYMVGVEPVALTAPPVADPRYMDVRAAQVAQFNGTEKRWEQVWEVEDRFPDVESLRRAVIEHIENRMKEAIAAGIETEGVPVKTDDRGLAFLTTLPATGAIRWVAKGKVTELNAASVKRLRSSVSRHVQKAADRAGVLIEEVNASSEPDKIDIDTGW